MSVDSILEQSASLYCIRKKDYPDDNWPRVGRIMEVLFPEGIKLNNAKDQERYHILSWCVGKLSRYCQNFEKGGHEDSSLDSIVYWAILHEIDQEMRDEIPF